MRWVLKAALQKGLSALPAAESANYLFQKHVTRSLPAGDAALARKARRAAAHVDAFLAHGPGTPPAEAVFYEFGAGWDLAVPLAYWALGVERQILVDIRPNVRLELVSDAVRRLAERRDELAGEVGKPLRAPDPAPVASLADLEARFGIRYLAPRDARATGLPAGSVDFVSSTVTLEHVPERDIGPIFRECRRLLRPGGALSCRIDLQDHSAYFDRRVSPYNYLRFSDRTWRLVNSALMYQNRLRAPDYVRLLEEAGFEVVARQETGPTDRDLEALARVPLAERFRGYPPEQLGARALVVVARPLPDVSQQPEDVVGRSGARVHPGPGA